MTRFSARAIDDVETIGPHPIPVSAIRTPNRALHFTNAQADAIRDLVRSASGANADAAAAAFGALRLPSSEAVDLILKARVPGKKPEAAPAAEAAPSDAPAGDAPSDGAGAASSEEPAMAEDPAGG